MKKRRFWVYAGLVILMSGGIATALLEPTQTVRGYLAGDAFYRGRPTRYWREVLRENGRNGTIPSMTVRRFLDTHAAFPVLRACARDPDRNVRWPAIALLGHGEARTEQILSALVGALDDEDLEVRLKAVTSLGSWGPMARSAVSALTNRLSDPELQVAHAADIALWDIDQSAAVKLCGWKPFRSGDWKFTVMLPDEPKYQEQEIPFGILHSFMTMHKAGPYTAPTCYAIAVSEYAAEALEGKSKEDMMAMSRDAAVAGLGGKLVGEQPIEHHGWKGVEHCIEVEGKGTVRTQLFWVDQRLYQVVVSSKPEFLNVRAADYFMESFQLDREGAVPSGPAQQQQHQHRE
jgi:HEAT repeat protein